jgi:hypothetical protein
MRTNIEILYDFKKIMMDTCPEILKCTESDCHGRIEEIVMNHIDELTDEQWRAVFDRRYDNLFQDGIPHISWNTDRSRILTMVLNSSIKKRDGYKTLSADNYPATWVDVNIQWIRVPSGTVIKYKHESPRVWSGSERTRYYGSVVETADVPPKATHCVAALTIDDFNKVHMVDQSCGTQDECEEWIVNISKQYGGHVFIKMMEIDKIR